MAYRRRHYRVAEREAEQNPSRGIFVPNKKRPKFMVIAAIALAVAFINGLITGLLISKNI